MGKREKRTRVTKISRVLLPHPSGAFIAAHSSLCQNLELHAHGPPRHGPQWKFELHIKVVVFMMGFSGLVVMLVLDALITSWTSVHLVRFVSLRNSSRFQGILVAFQKRLPDARRTAALSERLMINVPNSGRKPNVPAIYHVLVFCAVQCDFFLTAAGCLYGRATPYAAARAFVKYMATYPRIGQSAPDRLRSVEETWQQFRLRCLSLRWLLPRQTSWCGSSGRCMKNSTHKTVTMDMRTGLPRGRWARIDVPLTTLEHAHARCRWTHLYPSTEYLCRINSGKKKL